jgi:maltose O-acetyltransferase
MEQLRFFGAFVRKLINNNVIGSVLIPWQVRSRLLRLFGMRVKGAGIAAGTWFGSVDIEMGVGSACNIGCVFDNLGPIRIGRKVIIGHQVMFLTSHHDVGGPGENVSGPEVGRGITVGDFTWIGARATIMPGVTIGERCVIGAGAVVTRDCAPGGVYVGVPAKRLRDVAPAAPVGDRVPEQAEASLAS